jgi:antitoxin (DNA-binding transcriptional repressor) of toxin-antitoxin stability system
MKRANIGELRNHLSRYLEHVRGGGEVLVLDRDRPVARIVAPLGAVEATDDRLARLGRRGLVRVGTGGLPEWLGRRKPARLRGSVLRDLLAERRRGW